MKCISNYKVNLSYQFAFDFLVQSLRIDLDRCLPFLYLKTVMKLWIDSYIVGISAGNLDKLIF